MTTPEEDAAQLSSKLALATTQLSEIAAVRQNAALVHTATESARDGAQKAASEVMVAKTAVEKERDAIEKLRANLEAVQKQAEADATKMRDLISQLTAQAKTVADAATAALATKPTLDANVAALNSGLHQVQTAVATINEEVRKATVNASTLPGVKSAADADSARIAELARTTQQTVVAIDADKAAAAQGRLAAEQARAAAETALTAANAARDQVVTVKNTADQTKLQIDAVKTSADTVHKAIDAVQISAQHALELTQTSQKNAEGSAQAAELSRVASKSHADDAEESASKAEQSARDAQEAHNLSTTAGLAGAFNQKADQNKRRNYVWSGILILSLGATAWAGWLRYKDLTLFILAKPDPTALIAEVVVAIFGIGAPIWLAWVATRLVSKSLALQEDYTYKAALAQAYVGFRDQAKKLGDPILEQRLFAAAVTQLDANPVRLLDAAHPGSPLQDLLQQPIMQDLMQQNESLRRMILDWFNARFKTRFIWPTTPVGSTVRPPEVASPPNFSAPPVTQAIPSAATPVSTVAAPVSVKP